jgi:hypothetical protein
MTTIKDKFENLSYDLLVSLSEKTIAGDYLPTTFWTTDGYMISYDISACTQDLSTFRKTIVFSWAFETEHGVECVTNDGWGGFRPGAGRKPSGKKARQIYVTDEEYKKIKEYLESLRKG